MADFDLRCVLLLALLSAISGCRAGLPLTNTMSASEDEDVAFPCSVSNVTDPNSCYRVKWTKYDTNTSQGKVIFAWPKKFQDAKRVVWEPDEKGQMVLRLTKLQKSDEGLYTCELFHGWDYALVQNISLKIKDCKLLPPVKVPPGTTGKLKCAVNATVGQEGPQVSWKMLKGGNPMPVTSDRAVYNGTSLIFQSVHANDSGWYRCSYAYGHAQRCFETNLIVQEDVLEATSTSTETQQTLTKNETMQVIRKEESWTASIAAAASAIIGVVTIAALIAVFIYRRWSSQRVAQQTQTQPAGTRMQPVSGYECMSLSSSDYSHRVNSLYQEIADENMCTFHY